MVEPDLQAEYNLSLPLEELLEKQRQDPTDLSNEMNKEIFGGKVTDGFFIEAGALTNCFRALVSYIRERSGIALKLTI